MTKFKFEKALNGLNDYSSRLILKNVCSNEVHVIVSEDWGRRNLEKRKKVEKEMTIHF